jgi:hypothetical protein
MTTEISSLEILFEEDFLSTLEALSSTRRSGGTGE